MICDNCGTQLISESEIDQAVDHTCRNLMARTDIVGGISEREALLMALASTETIILKSNFEPKMRALEVADYIKRILNQSVQPVAPVQP